MLANQRNLVGKSGLTIFYLLSKKKLESMAIADYNSRFVFLRIL